MAINPNKITRLLPNTASNQIMRNRISEIRQLERELARIPTGQTPSHAQAVPATVIALAPVGALLAAMLQAIAVVFLALAALIILWYLSIAIGDAIQALIILIRQAVTQVTAARTRIREIVRNHPRGAPCMPYFGTVINLLNSLATRLNSPIASRPTRQFFDGLVQIAESLFTALQDLIRCLDPQDSMGLLNQFFGPNGYIMRALRSVRNLMRS